MVVNEVLSVVAIFFLPLVATVPVSNADDSMQHVQVTKRVPSTTQEPLGAVPDIVATLAVIGVCALTGIGIAKLADVIYDRHIARSSKKEVSNNTKNLLRARVAIMRMKADPKTAELRFAKKAASVWMSKTAGKKEDLNSKDPTAKNKIGNTHLPGIRVDLAKKEREKTTTAENTTVTQIETKQPQELHSIEKITVDIKPGGPLPPVVVHDLPSQSH